MDELSTLVSLIALACLGLVGLFVYVALVYLLGLFKLDLLVPVGLDRLGWFGLVWARLICFFWVF